MDVPPGSSRTSGGTALPPATPVGQIYTTYIDFFLDGNTSAKIPRPHIFSHLPGTCLGGSWPLDAWKLLWRPLEAPGGPACGGSVLHVFLAWKRKREGDLLEVGIEGVALNPDGK